MVKGKKNEEKHHHHKHKHHTTPHVDEGQRPENVEPPEQEHKPKHHHHHEKGKSLDVKELLPIAYDVVAHTEEKEVQPPPPHHHHHHEQKPNEGKNEEKPKEKVEKPKVGKNEENPKVGRNEEKPKEKIEENPDEGRDEGKPMEKKEVEKPKEKEKEKKEEKAKNKEKKEKKAKEKEKKEEKPKEKEDGKPKKEEAKRDSQSQKSQLDNNDDQYFNDPKTQKVPRLRRLLDILKKFREDPESREILPVLKKFGLPPQNALLDSNMKDDARSFDFGNFIKLMYSPVLGGYAPVNTANAYMSLPRVSPPVTSIRYKGVKMKPDQFLATEKLKALIKHEELDQVSVVADHQPHFNLLKELAIQQMSSLPLTVMFDILNEQVKVVEKICDGYAKKLGGTNQNTKVTQTHLQLMKSHLESLKFLGLQPLPPLSILHKFEHPPGQENPYLTPSSSSTDVDEEIDEFLKQDAPIEEEQDIRERNLENRMLQGESIVAFDVDKVDKVKSPKVHRK